MAGTVAGGAGALGLGQPERFEYRHGHGARPQRAVADQLGADGVGERLAALAGRVEDERAGALLPRQAGAELPTTRIYTQVSIRTLKQIHTATHPNRPISRTRAVSQDAGDARDLLLAGLDAEADEDDG